MSTTTDMETAVRWDSSGIHALNFLNDGVSAEARDVSDDGSIVAGFAENGLTGTTTAVTWNASGDITNLGYLSDGTYSFALAISGDGNVVVGYAQNGAGNGDIATRWVNSGAAESLGLLDGGTVSQATAVNSDGSYIAGTGDSTVATQEAFIWTEQSGMKGLGLLTDGTLSEAEGISANGAVVVGVADTTGNVLTGFRWTAETGMESILAWLQDNDPTYTLLSGNTLDSATAVSSDGNTVYGMGTLNGRDQPYVARSYGAIATPVVSTDPVVTEPSTSTGSTSTADTSTSTGSTTTGDTSTSASGTGSTSTGTTTGSGDSTTTVTPPAGVGVIGLMDLGDSLHNASLYAEAMQSQLQGFVQDQLNCSAFDAKGLCVSVSTQLTRHTGTVQGDNTYGGVTLAYRLAPNLVAGIGYQGPSTSLKINDDRVKGDTNTFGAFIEYGNRLKKGVFARGAVALSEGDATIKRSYLTGSGALESKGKTDVSQRAVSGQAGYVFIANDNIAVMPYLGLDYLNTKLDGYTETSGPFPARFDSRTEKNLYGTAGITTSMNLANKAIVSASLKHVERLNNQHDDLTGTVIGVSDFDLKQDTTERWNEVGVGMQMAGPIKASRVGVSYGHRFGSDKAVASDVATLSLSIGF